MQVSYFFNCVTQRLLTEYDFANFIRVWHLLKLKKQIFCLYSPFLVKRIRRRLKDISTHIYIYEKMENKVSNDALSSNHNLFSSLLQKLQVKVEVTHTRVATRVGTHWPHPFDCFQQLWGCRTHMRVIITVYWENFGFEIFSQAQTAICTKMKSTKIFPQLLIS